MARPRESQLRKGALELAVLALIARSEPEGVYGGALVESLAARPALAASQGTIYPLLSRLRRQGIVETTWRESPAGPPRPAATTASHPTASGASASSAPPGGPWPRTWRAS